MTDCLDLNGRVWGLKTHKRVLRHSHKVFINILFIFVTTVYQPAPCLHKTRSWKHAHCAINVNSVFCVLYKLNIALTKISVLLYFYNFSHIFYYFGKPIWGTRNLRVLFVCFLQNIWRKLKIYISFLAIWCNNLSICHSQTNLTSFFRRLRSSCNFWCVTF